ncbi:MAG: hypothetical protein U0230_18250 [Polyangiales bacterium]
MTTKFQVKLFLESNASFDVDAAIPVFHSWIRDKKLDELVIDVADYGHVPAGPGVVLIGHGSDYYVDVEGDRPGLKYSRKRGLEGDAEACLADAVRRAFRAAHLLEQEPSLGWKFRTDELQIRVNDRNAAPNSADTLAALAPAIEKVLGKALGGKLAIERTGEPRQLFTAKVTTDAKGTVSDALGRL